MKSFISLTFVIILSAIIFSSCSTADEQGKMIPKNALFVAHINSKSLLSKLSWDEIKQASWYKDLYSDTSAPAWTKSLMDDPSKTGIEVKSGFFIFFQKPSGTNGHIVFMGEIKDAKDFEAFNKNLDAAATAAKDGDINTLTIKNQTVVGWNNKKFVYIINSPSVNYPADYNPDKAVITAPSGDSPEKLAIQCKSFFNLSPDSNMGKIKRFSNLLKEEGDIHVWQNTEQIMSSSSALGMLGMLKLDVFFKGNVSTITASFEKGKIDLKQKTFGSKELMDLLEKYGGGKINIDMIKNIPSKNITGFVALHFKPEGIREIIKLIGMDGMANMGLSQVGITVDDFVKANKGDILFAATDFMVKKDSLTEYDSPHADFLFAVTIGDKPSFDKLMNAGKKLGGDMGSKIAYANNDKLFVVGNTQSVLSKYIAGGNNGFAFPNKLDDYPITAFVDIQKILNTVSSSKINDSSAVVLIDESIKIWDNVYMMGGDIKDDAYTFETEINLMDKNTNSLKQLNKYFDTIAKVVKEQQRKYKQNTINDSLSIYPPLSDLDIDTTSAEP